MLCLGPCKDKVRSVCPDRDLLYQRLFLQDGKYPLSTGQSLIQVIGKTGQRCYRPERPHHGNGAGKDPAKIQFSLPSQIKGKKQHAKRKYQDRQCGKGPLGALQTAEIFLEISQFH